MTQPPDFDAAFRDRLTDLFRWRRDIRHFRTETLPPGLLEELLAIACLAPSVGLSQPWRFVSVDDPARRAAVRASFLVCNAVALQAQSGADAASYARLKLAGLDEAPCHLAVLAETDPAQGRGLGRATMPRTTEYSAVMAVHTLWLAARAVGVGVGWVSILDPDAVLACLDMPPGHALIAYLCLGFPTSQDEMPELQRLGWEQRRKISELVRR